jgi:hypothetical protein
MGILEHNILKMTSRTTLLFSPFMVDFLHFLQRTTPLQATTSYFLSSFKDYYKTLSSPHIRKIRSTTSIFHQNNTRIQPLILIRHFSSANSTNIENKTPKMFTCWKCTKEIVGGTEFGYLLCPECGSPQRLLEMSGCGFYDLLKHEETYSVDVEKLGATAKKLQKRLHPDLFAGKGKVSVIS